MSEIKEIKIKIAKIEERGEDSLNELVTKEEYYTDIQTLLSSLEKEKERADKAESGWFVADKLEEFNRILDKKDERIRLAEERVKELEAKNQIYLQDIRNEQKLNSEIQGRLNELEGAIQQAQEENPDEKHCTCVPLLKAKIKELEAQLASIKADPSIGKLEIVEGWSDEEEDIYTEQDGKKIEEVK